MQDSITRKCTFHIRQKPFCIVKVTRESHGSGKGRRGDSHRWSIMRFFFLIDMTRYQMDATESHTYVLYIEPSVDRHCAIKEDH